MQKEIEYLKGVDVKLASVINVKLEKINPSKNVYEDLLSSIISQQISVKAAQSIERKFKSLFDNKFPTYKKLLSTDDSQLREAGLSFQKASYMKNVAEFFSAHNLHNHDFESMSDEEIIKMLTEIKGVGRWTVEMILIFTLGRPDIFSIKDIGLVNGVVKLYGLEKYHPKSGTKSSLKPKAFEEKILKITDKWSPHRSLASRYIWKYKDGDFDWEAERNK